MTAIALDDEWPALEIIETFCHQLEKVQLLRTFTRTDEARQYLNTHTIDLLFLDINMPDETGLYFAQSLSQQPYFIFTTAHSEYALESYDVQAVDYLLKPFTFERFSQAVQRTANRLPVQSSNVNSIPADAESASVFFRVDYGFVNIVLSDILFVKGLDNYLKIYLTDERQHVVRLTFKALLNSLPAENFIRVHRSYVVALNKITTVRAKHIYIEEHVLPIGSSYEKEFLCRLHP